MEIGGTMLGFMLAVAAIFIALAGPPMLIRWAIRQIRSKCFRSSSVEVPKMREAA